MDLTLRNPGAITLEHLQKLLSKQHEPLAFSLARRDAWCDIDLTHGGNTTCQTS